LTPKQMSRVALRGFNGKVAEFYRNLLLAKPSTQFANVVGTSTGAALGIARKRIASLLGNNITADEAAEYAVGMQQSLGRNLDHVRGVVQEADFRSTTREVGCLARYVRYHLAYS